MMMIAPEVRVASLPESLDRVYGSITRNLSVETSAETAITDSAPQVAPCLALERLESAFQLTPFERDVLLLCAGASLESRFAKACSAIHGDPHATWPTFGLALALLGDPHWSAVSRARPLRYWRLVEFASSSTLLSAPLRIDERILQFLIGIPSSDERLESIVHPLPRRSEAHRYSSTIAHVARCWNEGQTEKADPVLLTGGDVSSRQAAFVELAEAAGLHPYVCDAMAIPTAQAECDQLARLWTREALLTGAALYIRTGWTGETHSLTPFLRLLKTPVAVEAPQESAADLPVGPRVYVSAMDAAERRAVWADALGPLANEMNGYLDRVAEYFQFDEHAIRTSGMLARDTLLSMSSADPGRVVWRVCREYARRSLDGLAVRIEPRAQRQDLVLPASQMEALRQLTAHVRQRSVVHERWGFAGKHARGLGLSVLFAGASGTGKTMAAEIVAGELELDLYQIDLSAVVSKYIGETEKNLRRIFASAEQSGSVLLFDEADALFGKRSEVRDSHDRYANLEISYLLQQMESYRGIAILTTNMQHALDPAFVRRIRFIVQFPFPDAEARRQIWERIFPAAAPVSSLNFDQLVQLNVSGGVIRNIAVHAAFLAAEDGTAIEMRHLLAAARTEYQKMDKPLTAAETRGWA